MAVLNRSECSRRDGLPVPSSPVVPVPSVSGTVVAALSTWQSDSTVLSQWDRTCPERTTLEGWLLAEKTCAVIPFCTLLSPVFVRSSGLAVWLPAAGCFAGNAGILLPSIPF